MHGEVLGFQLKLPKKGIRVFLGGSLQSGGIRCLGYTGKVPELWKLVIASTETPNAHLNGPISSLQAFIYIHTNTYL